jgi:uncharacterized membrane protein YqhA
MTRTQEFFLVVARGLSFIAIGGTAIAGITLLASGGYRTVMAVADVATGASTSKETVHELIRVIDIFLIATVFYIMSVGFYQLFVDQTMVLPRWMQIQTVDDLKNKLLRVVVVVLAVDFLGEVVLWNGDPAILPFGAAIALVIAAVSVFLRTSVASSH